MKGSNSIKAVYPAICPEHSEAYSALQIGNGGDASVYLQALAEGKIIDDQKPLIRQQLLEYCHLDALAMVQILGKLGGVNDFSAYVDCRKGSV